MFRVRIEVCSTLSNQSLEKRCFEAQQYWNIPLKKIKPILVYSIQSSSPLDLKILQEIFCDPITQQCTTTQIQYDSEVDAFSYALEISFRPGVTDNSANSAQEALQLFGVEASVASGKRYLLYGPLQKDQAEKIGQEFFANSLIQTIHVYSREAFYQYNPFQNVTLPTVQLSPQIQVETLSLKGSDEELIALSQSRYLALSLSEMRHLQQHFSNEKIRHSREMQQLPSWPTDVELEILAQTWSEHCKHKIFNSTITYSEANIPKTSPALGNQMISSLFRSYIRKATETIQKERSLSWLISTFVDNAGIVRFDQTIDLCIKVETHNSPSALDPYGGALTGILGVNRDILGCGKGAKPIANTDVFCFAPPNWPPIETFLPIGLKHPRRIFEGVHLGVEDGGNKSGIPTLNGAFFFDANYAGKPLVFVGTVGILPQNLSNGQPSYEKKLASGDFVVMAGGAIGADGIHGATFSSMELNETAPATAVQIGDPLTQKRMLDFLLEARDQNLYSCITDNGAGGLSSSVGEMAQYTGGAEIDLALCPVKYPGLRPFELMISESQERMTLAVPPQNWATLKELATKHGVLITSIGTFNTSGSLLVRYNGQKVADLPLLFLHDSLPTLHLNAFWDGPRPRDHWEPTVFKPVWEQTSLSEVLLHLLKSPNIASKESWVRRYDHEVQSATHIKPFCGKSRSGPSDSGVIWLYPHGGTQENGVAIGCGMAPRISLFDPYFMAQFAVDEALRNVVASGGDPEKCCMLDNFCWPDPVASPQNADGEYKLGQLVRACAGLFESCSAYGIPLVSGKDSMKNDFRGKSPNGKNVTISVLPTLLVTAMAQVTLPYTCTTDFKNEGDLIYLVGQNNQGLAGSELLEHYTLNDENTSRLPRLNLNANFSLYRTLHQAIRNLKITACHDVSEGGALVSIVESMIGGNLGAEIHWPEKFSLLFFWNESPGRFILTVRPEFQSFFEDTFSPYEFYCVGTVTKMQQLVITQGEQKILDLSLDALLSAWKRAW